MKDLEKIKSEDLGCQVADANPGNFGIEQEVAQLVGATVPAPTEPSADDARELGAQLLVFLRRALLPIRSALRTALAAIYAHLDSRCTDYTPAAYASYIPRPYDPMGTPPTPRTVANLLTAITAFSDRKISGVPEAEDGVSLVRMLLDNTYAATITELTDDNRGYSITAPLNLGRLTGVKKLHVGAKDIHISGYAQTFIRGNSSLEEIELEAETAYNQTSYGLIHDCDNVKVVKADKLLSYDTTDHQCAVVEDCASITHFYARGFEELKGDYRNALISWCPELTNVYLTAPTLKAAAGNNRGTFGECPKLIDIWVGCYRPCDKDLDMRFWNPSTALSTEDASLVEDTEAHPTWKNLDQFLQNFKEHIALRLTDQGSGKTLTLSQAVFDTIWNQDGTPKSTDPDSVIYQINKIIKTDKHWSVNRA